MKNKTFRHYEIKRLDEANIRRSLNGALRRSKEAHVVLSIQTKKEELDSDFLQVKIIEGGSYFEANFFGKIYKGMLVCNICGVKKNKWNKYNATYKGVLIPISVIKYLDVWYYEKAEAV